MSSEGSSKKARWLVRTLRIAAAAVLLVFLLSLAGKLWIAPAIIRHEVCGALSGYWRGPVSLDVVEFSYFGPIRLGGLRFLGPAGREWAWIGQATFHLRNWPGPHPYLTSAHVERVRLTAHFVDGRCELPVLSPPAERLDRVGEYLDVQSVRIDDVAVALVDHGTGKRCRRRFGFAAGRGAPGEYEIRLTQEAPTASVVPVLSGSVNAETLESRLRLKVNYELRKDDADFLLAAVGMTETQQIGGFLDLDVSLTGRLDEPAALRTNGVIELTDARAETAEGRILDDLDLRVRLGTGKAVLMGARLVTPAGSVRVDASPIEYDLTRRTVSAVVQTLVAESAGKDYGGFWRRRLGDVRARGRIMATGEIAFDPNRGQPLQLDFEVKPELAEVRFSKNPQQALRDVTARRLRVRTTKIEARDLTATVAQGRAKLSAAFRLSPAVAGQPPALSDWAKVERLTGSGLLSMDDVDLVDLPVLPDLLRVMQVLPKGHKGISDLHVLFALANGVATVREGKLANPVSALHVEPGGKIDLRNRHLDLHVVVVAIQQLHAILKAIPLINLAVDFKDKLSRFHVLGPWDAPAGKLIRKEPLKDLSQGAEDFFKGVVRTGGQIGPGLVKGLQGIGEFFRKLDEALKTKPREPPP